MLFGCNQSSSDDQKSIYDDETVLIVNYELENMTLDEHAALGSAVAPNFVADSIPGLLGKSFIGDIDRGVFVSDQCFCNKFSIFKFNTINKIARRDSGSTKNRFTLYYFV